MHRGWAYLFFDSPKPALAEFQAAVKLDSKHAEAAGRGLAHARLGDHREAVADAVEALSLSKPETRATYNVARIYAVSRRTRLPTSARAEWGGCSSHGTRIWP